MLNKLTKVSLGLGLLLSQARLTLAATAAPAAASQITITEPSIFEKGIPTLGSLISGVVGLAMMIAALLAFIFLVWGGIEWIGSGGDKAGMESAKGRITNAFVGLFIVAAAWAITKIIESFFGITIISGPITLPIGHP